MTAFIIISPLLSPITIAMTYAMLGWKMTVARVVVPFLFSMSAGMLLMPLTYALLKLGLGPGLAFTFLLGSVGTCIPTVIMACARSSALPPRCSTSWLDFFSPSAEDGRSRSGSDSIKLMGCKSVNSEIIFDYSPSPEDRSASGEDLRREREKP